MSLTSRFLPVLLAMTLAACSGGAQPAARARVDTLPSGIVQVTSDAPIAWADSAHAWKFRVTLQIQPDEGSPGELMEPGTIGVDDWGRVYVADRKPAQIKVFDSAGAFVRTIGREGGGPGEYRVAFIAVRGALSRIGRTTSRSACSARTSPRSTRPGASASRNTEAWTLTGSWVRSFH